MTSDQRNARLILTGLAAAMLGVAALWLSRSTRSVDDFGCPKDGNIAGHTVVLVDQTDPLTLSQVGDLRKEALLLGRSLLRYEKFSIFTIGKEVEVPPRYKFSVCNPGRTDQIDIFTETASRADRKFKLQFSEPLETVLQTFRNANTEPQSPIIETIRAISELQNFDDKLAQRHLVVMSDFLQNSNELEQYSLPQISFDEFRQSVGDDHILRLRGASIDLFYLPRPRDSRFQGTKHKQFWADLFYASGAASVRWCYVAEASPGKEVVECARASSS